MGDHGEHSRHCPTCGADISPNAPEGLCPACMLNAALVGEAGLAPVVLPERETSLLLCLLAAQLRWVSGAKCADALAVWLADLSQPFPAVLAAEGALPEGQAHLLDRLAGEAIDYFDGDARTAFEAFGGEAALCDILSFGGTPSILEGLSTAIGLPSLLSRRVFDQSLTLEEKPGRYTQQNEFSRGGMGRILVVHDAYLSREIALKELLPQADPDASTIKHNSPMREMGALAARFLREAKVTGQLEHPSIVPVYEVGRRGDGSLYYTMKLVRGVTLRDVLRRAASLEKRVGLLPNFVDLCNAIAYAHSRNVIHRDIKPANIMVGHFGETVVIDWGLAKVLDEEGEQEDDAPANGDPDPLRPGDLPDAHGTATGAVLGTPQYMAPEQATGQIRDLDARTDVYALGVVLYEILTGQVPYEGKSSEEVLKNLVDGNVRPIENLAPAAPPELVSICKRAMAYDREDRYPSAKALADDVSAFQTGAYVKAYQYSIADVVRRTYRQHRPVVLTGAVACLVLLAGAIGSYINIMQARDDALVARAAEEEARLDAESTAYLSQIRLAQAYWQEKNYPAAREVLWDTTPELRHWEWGYLINQVYQEDFTIEGYQAFAVSPDSELIAGIYRDKAIGILRGDTGERVATIPIFEGPWVLSVEFNGDRSLMLARLSDSTVRVWDARTWEPVSQVLTQARELSFVRFGANGATLCTADSNNLLRVWDARTAEELSRCEIQVKQLNRIEWNTTSPVAAVQVDDDTVGIVDVQSGAIKHSLAANTWALSDDGDWLVAVNGSYVDVWNVSDEKRVSTFQAHPGGVVRTAWSPNGDGFLTTAIDNEVRVWDGKTFELRATLPHDTSVTNACFSNDGAVVATACIDRSLRVWDAHTSQKLTELGGHTLPMMRLAMMPDSRRLISSSFDMTIKVWPALMPPGQYLLAKDDSGIGSGVAISPDATKIAVTTHDGVFSVFDRNSGEAKMESLQAPQDQPTHVLFDSQGSRVVTTVDPFLPVEFDAESGALLGIIPHEEGEVTCIAIDPKTNRLATGGYDARIQLWDDSQPRRLTQTLNGQSGVPRSLGFSPGSGDLYSGDVSGTLVRWDLASGVPEIAVFAHEKAIKAIAWMPDRNLLLTGAEDGLVKLWDGETCVLRGTFGGGDGAVERIVVSDDHRRALVASMTGLQVWSILDLKQLANFGGRGRSSLQVFLTEDPTDLIIRQPIGHEDLSVNELRMWRARSWSGSEKEDADSIEQLGDFPRRESSPEFEIGRSSGKQVLLPVAEFQRVLARLHTRVLATSDAQLRAESYTLGELFAGIASLESVRRWSTARISDFEELSGGEREKLDQTEVAWSPQALDEFDRVSISASEENASYQVFVWCIPNLNQAQPISVSRTDAVQAIQRFEELVSRNSRANLSITNEEVSLAILENSDDYGLLKEFGMYARDRLLRVNGTVIDSRESLSQEIRSIREAWVDGSDRPVVVELGKGRFRTKTVTLVVSD